MKNFNEGSWGEEKKNDESKSENMAENSIEQNLETEFDKANETAVEIENLVKEKEISDAKKEIIKRKIIHTLDNIMRVVGGSTALAVALAKVGVTIEAMSEGGMQKGHDVFMDITNNPNITLGALAAATIALIGLMREKNSEIKLRQAKSNLDNVQKKFI